MFGFVAANVSELNPEQKQRYNAVYCGICRQIRLRHSNIARLGLRYDMAFLALLLMSLYEPEEDSGERACMLHPFKPKPWLDNEYIRYAADMNVALAYYKSLDDWNDEGKHWARFMAQRLEKEVPHLVAQWPRQCDTIQRCIAQLTELETAGDTGPDAPAGCFGALMAELMVYREDMWAPTLRQLGLYLGRFIYLADAVVDWPEDRKEGRFNPLPGDDSTQWEEYLILAMGRCAEQFEKLPLVQDKAVLDNIVYSGVWANFGRMQRKGAGGEDD